MAYLGRQPNFGNYRKFDDISSGFNGSTASFNLTIGGETPKIGSEYQIIISVNDVIQEPGTAYYLNGAQITFATPPTGGHAFFGILLGNTFDTVSVSDGTINGAKLASTLDLTGKTLSNLATLALDGDLTADDITANTATVSGSATIQQNLTVDGDVTFNGNTTIVNQATIETDDALIHLASNNETSDTLDIGFFGHYYDGTQNNHTGIIRDSGTKEYYIFGEFAPGFEPTTNIDITDGSFALANVHAAFFKGDGSQLTNAGSTVATQTTGPALFVPFTGISSGTMTSANVNSTLTFNPDTGTLSANSFSGDGTNLTGVGVSVSDDTSTNTDYYLLFTGFTTGAATSANVSSTKLFFNPSSGQLNATDFNSLSDIAFKKNVETLQNASETLAQLRGVSFNWKETGLESYGLIAQEVEDVLPEIVSTGDNGTKSVRYLGLIAYLIESNKELQERVARLESQVNSEG